MVCAMGKHKGDFKLYKTVLKNDEALLVERINNGDTAARDELIEKNIWVAVYMANKYSGKGNRKEDLLSVAYVGLVKAMGSFDPSRNVKPSSYARQCIKNEILMYLRRCKTAPDIISLEQPLYDEADVLLKDILADDKETVMRQVLRNENKKEVLAILKKLNERDRKILELRFGLCGNAEHTQLETAAILDITQSCVSKIEKKLFEKIKKQFRE